MFTCLKHLRLKYLDSSSYSRICNLHTRCLNFNKHRYHNGRDKAHYLQTRSAHQATSKIKNGNYDISMSQLNLQEFRDDQLQGVARLIDAYRVHGHKKADINPLPSSTEIVNELNPENYGLQTDSVVSLPDGQTVEISDLINHLEYVFCGTISVETSQLETAAEKEYLCQAFTLARQEEIDDDEKRRLAELLIKSQGIDHFIDAKFKTVKRYGGEGAESAAVFAEEIFLTAASDGIEQVIIGMPHRGRLNLLVQQLGLAPEILFRKMKGLSEFPEEILTVATGDVLSHLCASENLEYNGKGIHATLLPCPSHLEAVNPVAMGKCRGRQEMLGRKDPESDIKKRALCLLMHGDAAFAGQGIVAECFNMSNLPHFTVGGTVHLIVNNQLGFTTPSHKGRSSRYASDIGKITGCPVIHVNGDHPEDVAKAAKVAMQYRNMFGRDIIVDLLCFRRWGHNEMDDPSFTQPQMYSTIEVRKSVPDAYVDSLIETGIIDSEDVLQWKNDIQSKLNEHLKNSESFEPPRTYLHDSWVDMTVADPSKSSTWDTGYPVENLRYIGAKSVEIPDNLEMHSRLAKMYAEVRKDKMESTLPIDWATAEALAFGSLLQQDFSVRICGQDVGRGTFSHRHAMIVCQDSEDTHVPLNHITENQKGKIEVVNSLLSEEAVLGFEYGMSIENPDRLVIWESQFGDFFNGAQIIIDTFVNSGEAKWLMHSGIVILLPHGYDGMGPEHSSCKIERFLQGTNSKENKIDGDGINLHFCNPTTPAQYFHLLRRQMMRNYRKPLVVASPKTLLRLPAATSQFSELSPGTFFKPVLPDSSINDPNKVEKLIFCSGKHYYTLVEERTKLGQSSNVAVIRVEELCPFPAKDLRAQIDFYPNAKSHIWAQEEPRNMGAWSFIATRFENLLGTKLKFAGRPELPVPAVGIGKIHKEQCDQILTDAFN